MDELTDRCSRAGLANAETAAGRLRFLDFDDLFLMSYLLEGFTVTATAKRLGLSQPAVSHRVKRLEQTFGTALLEKDGRSLKLTERGEGLCRLATEALVVLTQAAESPHALAFTLGISDTRRLALVDDRLLALMKREPKLQLSWFALPEERAVRLVEAGEIDSCIASIAHTNGKIQSELLWEDETVLVASKDLAPSMTSPRSLEDLIFFDVAPSLPLFATISNPRSSVIKFREFRLVGSEEAALRAVTLGLGVSVLPRRLAQNPLAAGQIAPILPEIPTKAWATHLIYRDRPESEALVTKIASALRDDL